MCNLDFIDFQVGYQNNLQLSYMDKLLSDIQLAFRDKYKDELEKGEMRNFEFQESFMSILKELESSAKLESKAPKKMRTFEESKKSQKTIASMKIDPKKEEAKNEKNKVKTGKISLPFYLI
jgi:signal recognition particle receptor subunit alpha